MATGVQDFLGVFPSLSTLDRQLLDFFSTFSVPLLPSALNPFLRHFLFDSPTLNFSTSILPSAF